MLNKVSIVLLNWNGLHFIKKTIPPLLKLKYANYEIIVVDNHSTDGSLEYLEQFKDIIVIKNDQNLGYSKGKNIGAMAATGDYLLLLDNDVIIEDSDFLNKIMHIQNLKDKVISIPSIDVNADKVGIYGLFFSLYGAKNIEPISVEDLSKLPKLYKVSFPSGRIIFINRDFFVNKFGGYDIRQPFNLDDTDLGMFSWINGVECYMFNTSPVIHLGVDNADSVEKYSWRYSYYLSGYCTGIVKNSKMTNIIIYLPLLFIGLFAKAIKHSLKFKSLKVIWSYFVSIKNFILLLPESLRIRKARQLNRTCSTDSYFNQTLPKYDNT
jgi:GT2 family glycosyltransferase